jgi:MSHA pilin protein MshD
MIQKISTNTGFTLIELIITVVVLGIGATAFTMLIIQTTRGSVDPLLRVQANAIAQSYLEEILAQSFCDPNFSNDCPNDCTANACSTCTIPDGGRPNFNDICDYQGLIDAGARDRNGAPISGLGSYNVSVTVDDSASLGGLLGGAGQVIRVDVDVTHTGLPGPVGLSGYRVNF